MKKSFEMLPGREAGWGLLVARLSLLSLLVLAGLQVQAEAPPVHRRLYVASPGVRDYLQYGGHGLLVYAIDDGHKLLRRISTAGRDEAGKPLNVKGVCANAGTRRIYVSSLRTLTAIDLVTEKILWEKAYEGGCDRMSLSPDGKVMYLPSLEKDHWHVVDALSGDVLARIEPRSGAHNTVYGPSGRRVYLAGLRSPLLTVVDPERRAAVEAEAVGPFSAPIRPFTVNGDETLVFACVNDLLGFEVGDIPGRKLLWRVEVEGFQKGEVKRHGCPSHGIGLTPDEREVWACDAHNQRVHIFDATAKPPRQLASIPLREEPGWITFTIRGDLAYPSTGEVISTRTRTVVTALADEAGKPVLSEKLLEVDFRGEEPVAAGDQFGIGRKGRPPAGELKSAR